MEKGGGVGAIWHYCSHDLAKIVIDLLEQNSWDGVYSRAWDCYLGPKFRDMTVKVKPLMVKKVVKDAASPAQRILYTRAPRTLHPPILPIEEETLTLKSPPQPIQTLSTPSKPTLPALKPAFKSEGARSKRSLCIFTLTSACFVTVICLLLTHPISIPPLRVPPPSELFPWLGLDGLSWGLIMLSLLAFIFGYVFDKIG